MHGFSLCCGMSGWFSQNKELQKKLLIIIMSVTTASLILLPTKTLRYFKSSCIKKILMIHKCEVNTLLPHSLNINLFSNSKCRNMATEGENAEEVVISWHSNLTGKSSQERNCGGIDKGKPLLFTQMSLLPVQAGNDIVTGCEKALAYERIDWVEVTGQIASSLSAHLHTSLLCCSNVLNQGKTKKGVREEEYSAAAGRRETIGDY